MQPAVRGVGTVGMHEVAQSTTAAGWPSWRDFGKGTLRARCWHGTVLDVARLAIKTLVVENRAE